MMPPESNNAPTSFVIQIGGTIVALATISTLVLMLLFLTKPWLFRQPWIFPPGHSGRLLGAGLLGSLVVSGIGSLWMFLATRKPWWVAGLLIVAASVTLLILIGAAMGPGMH